MGFLPFQGIALQESSLDLQSEFRQEIKAEGRRTVKAGWEQRVEAAGLGMSVRGCYLVPGPQLPTGDEAGSVAH